MPGAALAAPGVWSSLQIVAGAMEQAWRLRYTPSNSPAFAFFFWSRPMRPAARFGEKFATFPSLLSVPLDFSLVK
jgi:hypothetical protein